MAATAPEVVPIRTILTGLFLAGTIVVAFIAGQIIDTTTVTELRAMEPAGQQLRVAARIHNISPGEYTEYRVRGMPDVLGVCTGDPPAPGHATILATYKRYHGQPELFGSCSEIYRR